MTFPDVYTIEKSVFYEAMRGANKMGNWKYTAFIATGTAEMDEFAAKTLHNMLENYRVPAKLAAKLGRKR